MNIEQIKTRTDDFLNNPSVVTTIALENGELETTEHYTDTDKVSRVTREMMAGDKPSYKIIKEYYESGQISLDDCLIYDIQGELLFRATNSYYPDGELKQSDYIGFEDKGDGRKQYSFSIKLKL